MNYLTNLIDFHTHLDQYNEKQLYSELEHFDGIIVSSSVNYNSYLKNKRIEQNAPYNAKIIPAFGIHPKYADNVPIDLSIYDTTCNQSPLIGEIGMDFCWYKDSTPLQQEIVFRYFLEHCHHNNKYCIIHTKDAEKLICRILEEYPNCKPIIHWYDGPLDIYEEFIHRGYYQTFGCETCRSKNIQNMLLKTPQNLILAETDNPESEIWLGGNDSSIFLINKIYQDIANVLGTTLVHVQEIINSNSTQILKELKL